VEGRWLVEGFLWGVGCAVLQKPSVAIETTVLKPVTVPK
jgi:hypothetical protein